MGYVTIDVSAAIDAASALLKRKDELLAEIAEVRDDLRKAVRTKNTTADQTKWINKEFPPQKKKTPQERVAEARARLAEVEKKAQAA